MLNSKVKLIILAAMSSSLFMVGCGEAANDKKVEETESVMTMEELLDKEKNILVDKDGDRYLYLTKNDELCLWDESDNKVQVIDKKNDNYDVVFADMFGDKIVYKKITDDGETGVQGYNYGTYIGKINKAGGYEGGTSFVSEKGLLEGYFIDGNRLVVSYDSKTDEANTSVILYEFGLDYGFELFNSEDYFHNLNIANNLLAFNIGKTTTNQGGEKAVEIVNDAYVVNIEGIDREGVLTENMTSKIEGMRKPLVYGEKVYGLRSAEHGNEDLIEYDIKTKEIKVILSGEEHLIEPNSAIYLLGDNLYISGFNFGNKSFVGSVNLADEKHPVTKLEGKVLIRKEFDDSLLIEKMTNDNYDAPETIYEIMKVDIEKKVKKAEIGEEKKEESTKSE